MNRLTTTLLMPRLLMCCAVASFAFTIPMWLIDGWQEAIGVLMTGCCYLVVARITVRSIRGVREYRLTTPEANWNEDMTGTLIVYEGGRES